MTTKSPPAEGDLIAVLWNGRLVPYATTTPAGAVVVLVNGKARILGLNEPHAVVSPGDAADFDLRGWQRSTRREMEDAAAAAESDRLRAALLDELRASRVVMETLPASRERDNRLRVGVLDGLGAEGKARVVQLGRKGGNVPVRRCWLSTERSETFVPERDEYARVLVVGAVGLRDGVHRLVGWMDREPVVLTWPGDSAPRVHVVRGGRWRKPGAEDPARWLEVTRQELEREARPDPEDIRAAMLDRLISEFAITPDNDGARVVLEVLVAEGYARRIEGSYVVMSDVARRAG